MENIQKKTRDSLSGRPRIDFFNENSCLTHRVLPRHCRHCIARLLLYLGYQSGVLVYQYEMERHLALVHCRFRTVNLSTDHRRFLLFRSLINSYHTTCLELEPVHGTWCWGFSGFSVQRHPIWVFFFLLNKTLSILQLTQIVLFFKTRNIHKPNLSRTKNKPFNMFVLLCF